MWSVGHSAAGHTEDDINISDAVSHSHGGGDDESLIAEPVVELSDVVPS